MKQIDEANTIMEGIELYGNKCKPFVVRNTLDFDFSYNTLKQNIIKENPTIYSTDKNTLEYVENINLLNTLIDWENNNIKYNFTDSCLDQNILDYNTVKIPELKKNGIGLTMCSDYTYTPFHIDSTSESGGGGWVYLYQGEKDWKFVEFFDAVNNMYDSNNKCLIDSKIPVYSLYEVYECKMTNGDFIYFPPGWAHQVTTTHKSIGLNGYMLLPSDHNYIKKINNWYNITSNHSDCGLLHRPLKIEEVNLHKKINFSPT